MEEFKKAEELKTTSESEISTDEELKTQKEKIPEKHKLKKKTKIKVSKFLKPTPLTVQKTKKAKFEEVFEKHLEEKEPKKIKLSYITPTPDQVTSAGEKVTEPIASSSGFGYIHPVKKTVDSELVKDVRDEREEERIEREPVACISEKELFENRISEKGKLNKSLLSSNE